MEQNTVLGRKKQYFTCSQKEQILQDLKICNVSLSQLDRHYGLSPVTIYTCSIPDVPDTMEVWSWDDARMIVGTHQHDIGVVPRTDPHDNEQRAAVGGV